MRRSRSLRRILLLVVASVVLSAIVTLGAYSAVSPRIFARAKMAELTPQAQFLADQAALYFQNGDLEIMRLFTQDSRQWGATVYLLDGRRNVITTAMPGGEGQGALDIPAEWDGPIRSVLSGKASTDINTLMRTPGDAALVNVLFIGVPVMVDGEPVGGVIMLKPLSEIVSAMSSLTTTLWLSALAVLLSMLPLVVWFASRITRPIWAMRDVALRMAAGDFWVRANDQEKGEMGDLAKALNRLSMELGDTIADLTHERNQAVAIINALGEGILAVDETGRPMQSNPALQAMMTAAGAGRLMPLPGEIWEDFRLAIQENRMVDHSFRFGEGLIHLTITPFADGRTGSLSAIGVFRDETQAHRLEQTRREYIANVSHELRTPLTALRAMIEPLRDGLIRTEEKRRETYDIILRETMRLTRLVDDMLELSRLQRGKLALEKVRFRLEPLIHDTASVYAAKAAGTGHILILDIQEKIPPVLGNPDRIEQVLVALLNNAFTYTPPGSHIHLGVAPMADHVRITVQDDGPGIRPEDLPHVFERFYKADKAHGGGGTGLGLAISLELMEMLGESITAENRETGGALFAFTVHYE